MKEPIVAFLICFAITIVCVLTQSAGSPVSDITWLCAVLSLIAVPLIFVRRIHPRDEAEVGVVISWSWRDFLTGVIAVAILLIPVALGNHFLRTAILGMDFQLNLDNYSRLETPLYYEIPIQFLCVAMPEEFFYRGYFQTAMLKYFRSKPKFTKAAPALAIALASYAFALAHLPSGNITRLLTFFPGLLFGAIRYRTGGLIGAIVCHACCNLMMVVLNVHYF